MNELTPQDLCLGHAQVPEALLKALCMLSKRQLIEMFMTALYDMQGQSQDLVTVICRALGMKQGDDWYWRDPEIKPKSEPNA